MNEEINKKKTVDSQDKQNEEFVSTGNVLSEVASLASSIRTAAILKAAKAVSKNTAYNSNALGRTVRSLTEASARLEMIKLGGGFVTSLAQVIDGWLLNKETHEPEMRVAFDDTDEETVEETVAEPPVEEPAVEVLAQVNESDDEDDEDEDKLPEGLAAMKLDYIDVMEQPEEYRAMLEQEARGEVMLVTRYRRSFASRLIQSQGNVQDYYSEIKNLLLSYKGVKGRVSWGNESFNRGRTYLAKVNAKTKTLYIYLAIDPKTLEDGKYEIVDVSDKKKYAAVPTLIKVKGDRKFKYAMELLTKLCEEEMALPHAKNFEAQDYHTPYVATEALVQDGLVKKMVAAIPTTPDAE